VNVQVEKMKEQVSCARRCTCRCSVPISITAGGLGNCICFHISHSLGDAPTSTSEMEEKYIKLKLKLTFSEAVTITDYTPYVQMKKVPLIL